MSNPIGEILSNRIGLRHGYQFRENDFTENGIQVIKIGNVTDDGLKLDTDVSFVSADRVREFENIIIKNGDILMSLTGNIGRVVEVQNLNGKILFQNYRVGVFYPLDEDVYKPFIKWVLSSEAILRQLSNYSNQSAQANFGKQDLDKLRFVFPKHKNQRQIAKILSTADAVIEKTQAAIAKYKAIKQGMLQDLFTRGIDLNTNKLRPRFEDAPELYKESKLGMIPREWEVKELQAIGDVLSGATPSTEVKGFWDGEITWITPADLSKQTDLIYFTKSFRKITEEGLQSCSAVLVSENSLVISSRAPIGYLSIVLQPFTTNQGCKSIQFFPNQVPEFYYYNLLCNVERLKGMGAGTTFAEISKSDLDFFEVVFCEEPEQIEIANRLKSVDMAIQTEQTYLQKMQSLKKGLMEDLLCGKKQVKVTEEVLTQNGN